MDGHDSELLNGRAAILRVAADCLDGRDPGPVALTAEESGAAMGWAMGVAIGWIRQWHLLTVALGLTGEQVEAIMAAEPEFDAEVTRRTRLSIDDAIASAMLSGLDT